MGSSLKGLTIGFDGKRAAQNRTGLGNYSRFIVSGLSRYADTETLKLYAPSAKRTHCLDGIDKLARVEMHYPTGIWNSPLRQLWRNAAVCSDLKDDGLDLFHGLSNELPKGIKSTGIPSIVTIHDLIFLRHPECYPLIDRHIYNSKFRMACNDSDRIIAVSECTKRDIVQFYGIEPSKIDVVYQGCDEQFWNTASDEIKQEALEKLNLPEHYILYVGSIERRKNLNLIAKALRHLPKDVQVIAVGKRTSYADEVEDTLKADGNASRLRMISGVPFRLLPALYQMADVFVYPSRFEGFGIPILEALVSGTPAIGCTGSCLEEAGGADSLYVSPDDEQGLANAISSVLNDNEQRSKMVESGHRYAENFRQKALTDKLIEVYLKVLGGKS